MKRLSTNDLPDGFGGRLAELRKRAGLRVPELAAKVGLSRAGLYYLESATAAPTWDTVCRLADALNIPTDVFRPTPAPVA